MRPFTILLFIALWGNMLHAQSASKLIKQAQKELDAAKYQDAIKLSTEALKLDASKSEAFFIRAKAHKSLGNNDEALKDFEIASQTQPKNFTIFYEIASIHLEKENFKEAANAFDKIIQINSKHLDACNKKALCLIKSDQNAEAFETAKKAQSIDKSDVWSFYYAGLASEKIGNNDVAEQNYQTASNNADALIKKNNSVSIRYGNVFHDLGMIQLKASKLDMAEKNLSKAIASDPQNFLNYLSRGHIMAEKMSYQNALNDYGQAIALNGKHAASYIYRAKMNEKLGQIQAAINDYNQALMINGNDADALTGRASCFISTKEYKPAIRDLKKSLTIRADHAETNVLLAKAKELSYAQHIEKDAPEIVFKKPTLINDAIVVREDTKSLMIEFQIKDASPMKSVMVNGVALATDEETINPTFIHEASMNENSIKITATDLYLNAIEKVIKINKTEVSPPIVKITSPLATEDNELFIESKPILFFEGQIKDHSKISSILINGTSASFPLDMLNPRFTATVNIGTKDTLTVQAVDEHGNASTTKFLLIREDTLNANPMGLTWVVFIENSEYKNLQRLDGPEKDVKALKAALGNYKIDRFEHKKNLTKEQLEKYFSIELRDQIQKNRVKSVIIWYAGHGKFLNETGYWIPIDGDSYEEFTYFSVNNLRSSLQSYTSLKHLFVISDACESGPAFYMAMRDELTEKPCEDWESLKYKSAQVFTSSNKEQSSDNSLFTQAFVNVLNNSKDKCISAEALAMKVMKVVKQNQRQVPKFGKIKGLDDENGTFYFIKKDY